MSQRAVVAPPLRYAGGKTWLINHIRWFLLTRAQQPNTLLEPFAGGGSVSLAAVSEGLVLRAQLVELDADVAAVWQTALGSQSPKLARRVLEFSPTTESVRELLTSEPRSTLDRAFRALVRNRVSRGGVMAGSAGVLHRGERGRGIASRWYPVTLARRVLAIQHLSPRITFVHGDGLAALERCVADPNVAVFADPPYTVDGMGPGQRLYRHHEVDHRRLFERVAAMRGHPLLSYEATPATLALALGHGLDARHVALRTAHHRASRELLVGRDLGWLSLAETRRRPATPRQAARRGVASDAPVSLERTMSKNSSPPGLVPVAAAAQRLGVTRRTVERLAVNGRLERVHEHGRSYITEASLATAAAVRAAPAPKPSAADLTVVLAGLQRLVEELREDRRALMESVAERELLRLEVKRLREELDSLRPALAPAAVCRDSFEQRSGQVVIS